MSKTLIKQFQTAAHKLGLYNGEIDGIPGQLTASALSAYFLPGDTRIPAWMSWAQNELGVSEVYGDVDNPRIVHYHSFTSYGADSDEVAWCSSFVNAGLVEGAGIKGTNDAGAASFKRYGAPSTPDKFGSIVLFKTNTGSLRHVAFSAGVFKGHVFRLGGNQSNAVNIQAVPVELVTECRYPIVK